jgi:hypothetical protein
MNLSVEAIIGIFVGLVPSLLLALRLRSEVNKNQADASRASFDLLERQLTASIDAAERLEGQVAILTAEVSALRERIVELEGLLNEVQRIAPGPVATARARRGRKPGAAKGAAKR